MEYLVSIADAKFEPVCDVVSRASNDEEALKKALKRFLSKNHADGLSVSVNEMDFGKEAVAYDSTTKKHFYYAGIVERK